MLENIKWYKLVTLNWNKLYFPNPNDNLGMKTGNTIR